MNLQNIPQEIKSLNQWVCSRSDVKIPMSANSTTAASSTNPSTWSTFEAASNAVAKGTYDYVGFVFNDNGIVGVDIDAGFDEEGFLSPLSADIIGACQSYTEKSKSGRGFHILLKGDLPFKGKNNRNGVEIYKTSRFFIMTGDILLYDKIIDNQLAIDYIVEKYFPEMRESEGRIFSPKIYEPSWNKPMKDGKITLRPQYPPITPGSRNICLTSLAGMMHSQGYSAQAIYDEISHCNAVACKPMLHESEIIMIVNSVTRYKR